MAIIVILPFHTFGENFFDLVVEVEHSEEILGTVVEFGVFVCRVVGACEFHHVVRHPRENCLTGERVVEYIRELTHLCKEELTLSQKPKTEWTLDQNSSNV